MSQGFPVSPGAFQTTFGGGSSSGCFTGNIDISIMKLSPDLSTRIYATFIGGNQQEMPQSMVVDPQGNLIIAGRTSSPMTGPGAYPVTAPMIGPPSFANSRSDYDIVITKLNSSGSGLIGSRRIGGASDDGANISACGSGEAVSLQRNYGDEARSEVIIDGGGNIYLAACTKSPEFPVQGAFQATKSDNQDGIVLKMTPDLNTLLFSSFLG